MNRILRRLGYWRNRARMDAELAEEMEFHRAMLAKDGGERAAMGNMALAKERARGVWIWPWLESLWQDVAYAVRTLRRQPGFTATALISLGSAIGINTSLFTIFNAVALRPWPVHDPSRVVLVHRFTPEGGGGFGIAEFRYFAQHSKTFSGLIAMSNGERVKIDDQPGQLTYVSGDYFRVLGVNMERGRGFLEDEDRVGAPRPVIVIGHDLWQNRFGGDPLIIGRSIRLDGIPFTVVGVTPSDFTGTSPLRNDIWIPLPARLLLRPNDPSIAAWLTSPNYCCTPLAGRLAPGATRAQAQAEMAILLGNFQAANRLSGSRQAVVLSGTAWMESPRKKRQAIPSMLVLFLAVTLVLLLACANVSNLLLARAAARQREIAVRLSLGGGRFRIVRQLLVESILLAVTASGLGFAMSLVAPAALMNRLAPDQAFHVAPDLNVLAYTIVIALLSCLAFGLAPALHGVRWGISAALKAGADGGAAVRARLPLRTVLLAVQVAISVVLLANAGLLVQGLRRSQALDPGFDVRNVTVLSIDLPASEYTGPRTAALTRDLLTQLEHSPDLPACGLALNPPSSNATYSTSFQSSQRAGSPMLHIYSNDISGGYVDAAGMRLLAGRNFVPEDTARNVVMINEAAAKRWWQGESPLGKTVFTNGKMSEIVGIVSDTYTNDLSSIEAVVYFPLTGRFGAPSILVRDRSAASVDRVAALVKQIEPRAQIHAEPLADSFHRKLQPST
jgi:predicted permease